MVCAQPPAPKGIAASGYAATDASVALAPFDFLRRDVGPTDVQIDILFCGVCHSDIHTARNEWLGTVYPCVPGHEIVGRVSTVGNKVTRLKVGDVAAVGCMVDSCQRCPSCAEGLEQFCENGTTFTYNSPDPGTGKTTYGGYSTTVVVTEKFVVKIPAGLDPKGAAPLLCAGVTTYSPMRHWKVLKGQKVGVVGIGGLGHVAVKIARALGARPFAITTSPGKIKDAGRLGAEGAVLSSDAKAMKGHANSFDFILSTVPRAHDLNPYVALLKRDRTLVVVGALDKKASDLVAAQLIHARKSVAGSLIGGMAETQEVVDFCAKHKITADVEVIPAQKINEAYDRVVKKDVRYRFVIDMASLKK
ncbi:NAD(P)-dependent alcohol dehydrogenase [Frigoriglobus tundricola]